MVFLPLYGADSHYISSFPPPPIYMKHYRGGHTYLYYSVVDLKASLFVCWTFLHDLGHKDSFIRSAVVVVLWE